MSQLNVKKRNARRYALQALYQWDIAAQPVHEILVHFIASPEFNKMDDLYFQGLVKGVVENCTSLDEALQPHMPRKIKNINPVERAILRLAAFELIHRLEVPHKVVLNEAIELGKEFGAEEGYKFVNAALDSLCKVERANAI